MRDIASVRTTLRVQRWDADQVDWTMSRMGIPGRGRNHANVTIAPGDFARHQVAPYSVTVHENANMILQGGWTVILGGIAGTSIGSKFSAANGRIGVGTSTTAASYTQTALVGDTGGSSTTSYYQLVSAAPVLALSSSPPTLTLVAAFGTGVANFAWNEFGTDNYTASGVTTTGTSSVFLNRGVSPQGSKPSGQIWAATEVLEFGYPADLGALT